MLLSSQKNSLQKTLTLTRNLSQKHPEGNQQFGQQQQEHTGKISLLLSKMFKKRNSKKQKNSFWSQQLKRIIQNSKLTINISEKSKNQGSLQLRIQNFQQLQSQLVRDSVFEYYKQLNKKIGDSQGQIFKEYRLQQQRQIKFRLDPSFKIKIRNNIYQKQGKQNKRSQSSSLPPHLPYQIINNVLQTTKKQDPRARFSQKFQWRKQKWKLTDFFNSILSQQQKAKELMEKRRQRIELAIQLSKLEKKCEQLEQNQNQKYLLDTFERFNMKLNDKLFKRQRRLSKVKFITRNDLP